LTPLLFVLVIADVEEETKKGQVGGVLIGKDRIWTLTYADERILLAKNEESMKEIMKRLKRYLRGKNLQRSRKCCILGKEGEGEKE